MFVNYKTNDKLDLCNSAMPDERAIMTYVSSYYHCFAGKIKVNLVLHSRLTLTDVHIIFKMLTKQQNQSAHFDIFTRWFEKQERNKTKKSLMWTRQFFSLRNFRPDDTVKSAWVISYCLLLCCSSRFHPSDCAWHVPSSFFLVSRRVCVTETFPAHRLVNGITMSFYLLII